jgi:xanthine dehydrogenase accessory factor
VSFTALDASRAVTASVEAGRTAVTLLVVSEGPERGSRLLLVAGGESAEETFGSLGSLELDAKAAAAARAAAADPRSRDGVETLEAEGRTVEVYREVRRPIPDLVIVGAGHIAQPMSTLGATLGFRVLVIDDRPDFATRERFPEAEEVHRVDFSDPFADVPIHERTHVLLVTRGHKYDYECLLRLVRGRPMPAYIGMIGSRRRVRATYSQLIDEGIPRSRLEEIHAPVGLDIGAETPEEIAVAVAAELIKVQRGGSGRPLRELERVADRFFSDEEEPSLADGGAT